MTSQKLSFYTTGESFTNLLNDLYLSGEFSKVINTLRSGGMKDEMIKDFLMGKIQFEGDTREGDLYTIEKEYDHKLFVENLLTAYRTCISNDKSELYLEYYQLNSAKDLIKEFQSLLEIFTFKEIQSYIAIELLLNEGYSIANPLEKNSNGVILQDGTFIKCDYQEHIELYSILYSLNLASNSRWIEDIFCIHVSSGSISGKVAYAISALNYSEYHPTDEQIKTIFKYKNSIHGLYGENESIVFILLKYIQWKNSKGGKFNNLSFLKYFYSDKINIPIYSLNREDIQGDKIFIRTSPKKSLPGLLHSKLIKNDELLCNNTIIEMNKEFSKYIGLYPEKVYKEVDNSNKMELKLFDNNELFYFYQEFIEGKNGVCHYFNKGEFTYAISKNQGDIVQGKLSNDVLDNTAYNELRKIASILYEDLKEPIQLEFIVDNENKIWIVQLRILENNYDKTVIINKPENEKIYVNGLTFSKGNINVKVNDILIVDSDGDSELLLGKKALIVKSNVEFSHLLALSKQLKIPSIYNTGEIDLSELEEVKFTAYNKEAWITKK